MHVSKFVWFAGPLALAMAVVAGCGSDSSSTSTSAGGGSGTSVATACADRAKATCTQTETCSATVFSLRYADEATCESRLTDNCEKNAAAPDTGQTAAHIEACVSETAKLDCDDFFDGTNTPTDCIPAIGTLEDGSACGVPGQCKSGYCSISATTVCGKCAPPPAVGDACDDETCGPNLVCSAAKKCTTYAAANAHCNVMDQPCGSGLVCQRTAATDTDGTCVAAADKVGMACAPGNVGAPSCSSRAGLTCDLKTKVCEALTLAGANEPCGKTATADGFVVVQCAARGYCTGDGTKAGTCTPAAADGAACDTTTGPNCILPSKCVPTGTGTAGVCTISDPSQCK